MDISLHKMITNAIVFAILKFSVACQFYRYNIHCLLINLYNILKDCKLQKLYSEKAALNRLQKLSYGI